MVDDSHDFCFGYIFLSSLFCPIFSAWADYLHSFLTVYEIRTINVERISEGGIVCRRDCKLNYSCCFLLFFFWHLCLARKVVR